MRILVVEDNQRLASYIKKALRQRNYAVDRAYDGELGAYMAVAECYDLIILDVLLPKKDGFQVCRELRDQKIATPVLLLTAREATGDKVHGLDIGADDYLTKPFELAELLARIRALLRRPKHKTAEVLTARLLRLNRAATSVAKAGEVISLAPKEFAVLEYLMINKNQTLTREQILEHCWDDAADPFSNVVDAHIKQIRKKIDDEHAGYIKTIRGIGYQLQG